MNTVFRAAAETVQHVDLMAAMTVQFLLFFVGWAVWAYMMDDRSVDAASALPFDDGDPT
jgi:cbb3-type cytochrome oxidase subunit 3